MRRLCLVVLLTLLVAAPAVSAQEKSPAYRLRKPTLEEYLKAVPAILKQANSKEARDQLSLVIDAELAARYFDATPNASSVLLSNTRSVIWEKDSGLFNQRYIGAWDQALILALLRENAVDLDKIKHIRLGTYSIDITPRDFNADGVHEWLLEVEEHEDVAPNFLILQRGIKGGYRVVPTPLPWFNPWSSYWDAQSGKAEEVLFADINKDGLPEWIVAVGGIGGGHMDRGWLEVMAWRDGKMVSLIPDRSSQGQGDEDALTYYQAWAEGGKPLYPYGVAVGFARLQNGTLSIQIRQEIDDNWGCTWTRLRTFQWSGKSFALSGPENILPDSRGCAWREAEGAMWKGDFKTAIAAYERGLKHKIDENDEQAVQAWRGLTQYVQARLAVAYAMTGQTQQAGKLLTELHAEKPDSQVIAELTTALAAAHAKTNDPLELCSAAYAVFQRYVDNCIPELGGCDYIALPLDGMLVGMNAGTDEVRRVQNLPLPDPARVGCDINTPVLKRVTDHRFGVNSQPVQQLAQLGFKADTALRADFNGDGRDDWLIWLTYSTPPLFFMTDRQNVAYVVSYAKQDSYGGALLRPSKETRYFTWPLPGKAGAALVSESRHPSQTNEFECPPPEGKSDWVTSERVVRMWRWAPEPDGRGNLYKMLDFPLCQSRTFEQVFVDGPRSLKIRVPAYGWDDSEGTIFRPDPKQDVIFIWDDESKDYVEEVIEAPPPTPEIPAVDIGVILSDVQVAFAKREYAVALKDLSETLARPGISPEDVVVLRYWRAMAFDLLGNSDAALADYIAVYRAAPHSGWGMLAALHLEPLSF